MVHIVPFSRSDWCENPGLILLFLSFFPAVQEERQRGKDRNENEVESTSNANEDMPVEKILEAELAVEPKTETYIEANMGLTPNSVRKCRCPRRWWYHLFRDLASRDQQVSD